MHNGKTLIISIIFVLLVLISGCAEENTSNAFVSEAVPVRHDFTPPESETPQPDETNQNQGMDSDSADPIKDEIIYEISPWSVGMTFNDVTKKVPEIADLGVTTIYLMPIWGEVNGSPYGIMDYYSIPSYYGTEGDLKKLVDTVHDNDMKIVFDLVTSVIPEDSKLWKEGCALTKDGEPYLHPYGWGVSTDLSNIKCQDYFVDMALYYIDNYNIDGWRIDSPQRNHDPDEIEGGTVFLVLEKIRDKRPDVFIITETSHLDETNIYEDPIYDRVSDISMDWDTYRMVDMVTETDDIEANALFYWFEKQPIENNKARGRFIENHDTPRAVVKYGIPKSKALFVLSATTDQVPWIYAGQEYGSTDEKASWGENPDIYDFYKTVLKIRKDEPALRYGAFERIMSEHNKEVLVYLRSYQGEEILIIINLSKESLTTTLDTPYTSGQDLLTGENVSLPRYDLGPYGFTIIKVLL